VVTTATTGQCRTITDAAEALRIGAVTATQLVDEAIAAADADDERIGVFLARFVELARERAERVDEKIASGIPLAPLDGIPVGLKDMLACAHGPTTAQSLVLDPAWAASVGSCTVAQRLERAGAIVTGKVTTQEFAIGPPDPDKPFPIPRNPWDTDRWAGGSSSGSGSGVAAGMFLGAIGTDTGGSIRIPAAFNGITGLKPTFGLVPKSGTVPLAYTLDHVGPMARSAADCALMLSVIAGADPTDPYSSTAPVPDYTGALTGDLAGVTVGVDNLDRYAWHGIDPNQPELFAAAVGSLEDAGAVIVAVELPMYLELMAIDLVVLMAEGHAYHRRTLRSQWDDYGRGTRVALAAGDAVTGADYVQAQRVRRVARQRIAELFTNVDLIVTPTGHLGAPRIDAIDQLNLLTLLCSIHTAYWSPLGNPTLAVPIGLSSDNTPLSMSISGRPFADADVLRAGDAFQRRMPHHMLIPTK
jgi:aspartyl-tRNA(Asn)/glutamyl-tRNA(Gln) amidotransferase subunit A